MNTLTLEGWYKQPGTDNPQPIECIHFRVSEECHLRLEAAEEQLQKTQQPEVFVDLDMSALELETSTDCGPLRDCQLRVYLHPLNSRGHFHLVGHKTSDNSLVYSNAVMVDQLG